MPDRILKLGQSIIQHGAESDRVYALRLDPADMPGLLDDLEEMAMSQGYGKIVAKARGSDFGEFAARAYQAEALVPQFFSPGEAGVFMGKFLDPERAIPDDSERIDEVLKAALEAGASAFEGRRSERSEAGPAGRELDERAVPGRDPGSASGLDGLILREAEPDHVPAIASCYGTVFESYPFPIHDPDHLEEEMERGTRFFAAWEGDRLVAASSMEPGGARGTVEMTDFATLPGYRGRGLATRLLTIMDRVGRAAGLRVAYTIARARSFGMNLAFARRGYRYGGTLTNNTQIAGAIESMNVWFKPLGS